MIYSIFRPVKTNYDNVNMSSSTCQLHEQISVSLLSKVLMWICWMTLPESSVKMDYKRGMKRERKKKKVADVTFGF